MNRGRATAWSDADDDRLRQLWSTEPLARLAPSLGRSQACVQNRARKLGLVNPGAARWFATTPWTEPEDQAIRSDWARIDSRTTAERLNRSHDAVCRRARKLGLAGGGRVRDVGSSAG